MVLDQRRNRNEQYNGNTIESPPKSIFLMFFIKSKFSML
jgi:hypothetical protein